MAAASPRRAPPRLPFHYGWVIVATGALALFACLGLGRFAIGMLLPTMAETLGLTYGELGAISTANFVGYLAAVVAVGPFATRLGHRKAVVTGLVLVGTSMVLIGRAAGFAEILALYFATGVGTGAANVPVMAIVSHWFGRRHRGRAAGFVVAGSGFGIIATGLAVPAINGSLGAEGWRTSWLVLGAVALAAALVCGLLLRNDPSEMALRPVGAEGAARPPAATPGPTGTSAGRLLALHLGAVYFLFGFTYVIYATFIVTTLVREHGFSEAIAGRFWSWIGVLSLVSGPVFGALSDRFGRRVGFVIVFVLQASAYLLAGLGLSKGMLYISIGAFGIVAWSIPTIMAAAAADYFGPARVAATLGLVTFYFGVGQIVGPGLAGLMAEASGAFASSYYLAAALAAAAVLLSLLLPRPRTTQ